MSAPHTEVLKELDTLQRRVDELRSMLRSEAIADELPDGTFYTLVCKTDQEVVGIILRDVEEVLALCWVAPVPDAPIWCPGLLNLAGEMVPVLDLNARIKGTRREPKLSDSIVICNIRQKRLGLIVVEVLGVREMDRKEVQAVSEHLVASPYLLGVAELDGSPMLMLNVSSLLSTSRLPDKVS
jgi:purine-binding chemotaxis protein CheW